MATEDRLPPACAFAVSVLAERDLDPDAVPEEAVEAAQQHIATCARCSQAQVSSPVSATPRKKRKTRRVTATEYNEAASPPQPTLENLLNQTSPYSVESEIPSERQIAPPLQPINLPSTLPVSVSSALVPQQEAIQGYITCQQCREMLPEYAEAMDSGENVALLYPEMHDHLMTCESGCLVLLDVFQQEAKTNRKFRRKPVRDPFRAMWWSLTGFFRSGQISMSPMALSYGVLILLIIFASASTYIGINWHEAIYHPTPHPHLIPTPDGIGLSDGLKIYDACNTDSFRAKRAAAQALQRGQLTQADTLLKTAVTSVQNDTTGCNGAEAAIYRENLHVRQSGHPYSIVLVSFDSGPGNADPQGGTDRHILYAAYTQELVGAFISQQQYNAKQMQTPDSPLLYLVLANTTGIESGALQIANATAAMVKSNNLQEFGLLASGAHHIMAVLGLGPSSLVQVVLPVLCRAGVPLIAPTATGLFIIDLLTQTSLYRHCTSGFAFIRFSPDDVGQSSTGASYAYHQLHAHNAAIFYDPSNPSSKGSAQGFSDSFTHFKHTSIVARETAVASGLLDENGRPQASRDDLLAGLNDALHANPRPDLIYAPLLTNDVITLAQAIAKLPSNQQPRLMIGGEFVQPTALQGLVQWARQQQLSLPHVYIALSSAARPPTDGDWQKQFYATFCTSFATPGSFCSGAAALDQGALFFADGIEIVAQGIGPITDINKLPTTADLVQHISAEHFAGVSCPISLHLWDNVLVTSKQVFPVIMAIQQDGSMQIVG